MTTLELTVSRFLEHKRAVGRKYESEEAELRLLVRFAEEHGAGRLEELTPVLLDDFLASRSRPRPRGFNHLLGVVRRLLDWAVAHELLEASPQTHPRRETATRIPFLFDTAQVPRLLDAAAALPEYTQAPQRGSTYRTIFALCYGLGPRVGEASALRVGDVDRTRSLLVVKRGKFGKSRLVPHGPRIGELVGQQLQHRSDGVRLDDDAPAVHLRRAQIRASAQRQPDVPSSGPRPRVHGARRSLPTRAAQPASLGGRRGYAPCRGVSAGWGVSGGDLVRITAGRC
jgi:integrase